MSGQTNVELWLEQIGLIHERPDSAPSDRMVALLANIARSLAVIADHLEGK